MAILEDGPDGKMQINLPAPPTVEQVTEALSCIVLYGGIDGAHHKTWVLDQVTRALTGESYDAFVAEACDGEDGPGTYEWDTGIAP